METAVESYLAVNNATVYSRHLKRDVSLTIFPPGNETDPAKMSLLLLNDGQDMDKMNLEEILQSLYKKGAITPVLCVAIHAGKERTQEYGIASRKDYLGRGAKAALYTQFILTELLPYLKTTYGEPRFKEIAFAGFSLGGLTALDIVWNHPEIFSRAGIFSGSLWWRSVDQTAEVYDDDKHRIMQQQIRLGRFKPGLQFFFQCGKMDESGDRNNNGIIDSIDDTMDVIKELLEKGYPPETISYLELDEGKHDVATWGKAMPVFLKWGWGR